MGNGYEVVIENQQQGPFHAHMRDLSQPGTRYPEIHTLAHARPNRADAQQGTT